MNTYVKYIGADLDPAHACGLNQDGVDVFTLQGCAESLLKTKDPRPFPGRHSMALKLGLPPVHVERIPQRFHSLVERKSKKGVTSQQVEGKKGK